MISSLYLDTSVFGGYYDSEFSRSSIELFDRIIDEKISILISDILTAELEGAPEKVKDILYLIPENQKVKLEIDEKSEHLSRRYVSENVVGKTSLADCFHIALATIHHADILVSWNFKHIVNIDRIRGYNSVNLKLGYPQVEIRSPLELGKYE